MSARLIDQLIKSKYEDANRVYRPKDIMADILAELHIDLGYSKAWRARECALTEVRGSFEESYAVLPSYCHELEAQNLGIVTAIETDAGNRFKYFFHGIGGLH